MGSKASQTGDQIPALPTLLGFLASPCGDGGGGALTFQGCQVEMKPEGPSPGTQ